VAWTYKLRYTKCGKRGCNVCSDGPAHGPYWYGYEHVGGRVRTKYFGKLPPGAEFAKQTSYDERYARWEYHGKMSFPVALRIMGFENMPARSALIKRWRELVSAHHPDIGGDTKVCSAINAAYTFLKQPWG